jgi:hypothetical protein
LIEANLLSIGMSRDRRNRKREIFTGIITRLGGGSRRGFLFVEDVRNDQHAEICKSLWLDCALAASSLDVRDNVKLEIVWTRLSRRPFRFKVERASPLNAVERMDRAFGVELYQFGTVATPSTYIEGLRDAKALLKQANFAPAIWSCEVQASADVYCPYCRTQLGIRLTAVCLGGRWFRTTREDSSHTAATCQANIAAVIETLRQRGRANQALRKLYVSRVSGKCTELEWQQIIELQGGKCFDCKKERLLTKGHLVPIVHTKASLNASNVVGQCRSCNGKQGRQIHIEALRRKLVTSADVKRWKKEWSGGPPLGLYRPRRTKISKR